MISFTEFSVVGKLSSHKNLRGSSTISRLADDVPEGNLLRARTETSLVFEVVRVPVIPCDTLMSIDGKIVAHFLSRLRSTTWGEGASLGTRVLVEVWRKVGRVESSLEIGRSQQ